MNNNKDEYFYLSQLDKGNKIYKWRLKNFVIGLAPLLIFAMNKSIPALVFSLIFALVYLSLTYEPNPNENLLNYMKVRIIYMFKKKNLQNQQSYNMKRLREISSIVRFNEIKDNHITLVGGKVGVFFEYAQFNPDLMSKREEKEAIKNRSDFLSNFLNYKELVIELSQSLDEIIHYNQGIKSDNPIIQKWIDRRTEYINKVTKDNKEDEKTTLIYLETKEDDLKHFIMDTERLGVDTDLGVQVVEGNKLKRIMASLIADVKFNNIYPANTNEAIELEVEDEA